MTDVYVMAECRMAPGGISRIPVPIPGHRKPASAPSRLQQIQRQYQRQLYHEKADKLLQLYQEHQQQALNRIVHGYQGTSAARDFFTQRRNEPNVHSAQQRMLKRRAVRQYSDQQLFRNKPPLPPMQTHNAWNTPPQTTNSPKPPPFDSKPKWLRRKKTAVQSAAGPGPGPIAQKRLVASPASAPRSGSNSRQQDTPSVVSDRPPSGRTSSRISVQQTEQKIAEMQARLVAKIEEQQKMLQQMKQESGEAEREEQREAEKRHQRELQQAERRRKLRDAQRVASTTPTPRSTRTPSSRNKYRRSPSPACAQPALAPTPPPHHKQMKRPAIHKHRRTSNATVQEVDTTYYESACNTAEAQPATLDLQPCRNCGRKFASDRLAKHMTVCQAIKKRKVFDPTKMRTQGTELEAYNDNATAQNKNRKPLHDNKQASSKNDWRQKHQDFLRNIHYAKKVTMIEKQGGNVADLPPPPPSHNPDYVQCPHCQRRFNQGAAERHIPNCKERCAKAAVTRKQNRKNSRP